MEGAGGLDQPGPGLHRRRRLPTQSVAAAPFYRALEQAGLRRVVLYARRHTMATLVLSKTRDLKLVAVRLPHADETLARRTYGHLLPVADRATADRLGEAVRHAVQH